MAADGSDDPEAELVEALDRREFLRLMGASIAMTTGCTSRPRERVLPYVEQPPEVVPGRPLWFATSMTVDGYGHGLLVESHEGRPTKVEGHPEHPANLGAASLHAQASILGLYDPDRARSAREQGRPRSVRSVGSMFAPTSGSPSNRTGAGLHVLMGPTSSPLVGSLLDELAQALPQARVHFHAPLAPTERWEGARLAFGRVLETQHDFRKARVVVAFDADFLGSGPAAVRHARDFMSARRVRTRADQMNRLYVVESTLTSTGAKADHRLRRRPSEMPLATLALLSELRGLLPKDRTSALGDSLDDVETPPDVAEWARVVAGDLAEHPGEGLLLVGDRQPAALHALIHAVNELLGNAGSTVTYTRPPSIDAGSPSHGLRPLVNALAENAVGTLIILDGNPVYTAPERLAFAQALERAPRRIYLGQYENETAALCPSFLPALHYLESWGDTRAFDGTVSFVQPLVEPLYGGFSPAEILAALVGRPPATPRSLLRSYWAGHGLRADDAWDDAIGRGLLPGSAFETERCRADVARMAEWVRPLKTRSTALFEVQIVPDARVFDGRFANNAWLQETPDPMSRLSWGNAALVSSRTAQDLGVVTGGLVRIATHGASVDIPVLVMPGQADGALTIPLGYGRRGAEAVARDVGVSVSAFLHEGSGAPSELSSVAAISGSACSGAATRSRLARGQRRRALSVARQLSRRARQPRRRHSADALSLRSRSDGAMGNVDRSDGVHRVLGVRRRVPGGKQRPRRRERLGAPRPRDALDSHRSLPRRRSRQPVRRTSADALPALREGAVRIRLPGRRHDAQRRGAERDDVQPLRRHAFLLE